MVPAGDGGINGKPYEVILRGRRRGVHLVVLGVTGGIRSTGFFGSTTSA
jgi:hypothetical protein